MLCWRAPRTDLLCPKVALGIGDALLVHVGQGERWEVLLAGAPLEQVSSAEHEATLGAVVVSPELWRVIEQCVIILSLNDAHCGALYVGQGDTIAVSSICMDRPIRCSVAEGTVSKASGNATVATLKCAPRQPPRPAPIEMSAALNDAVAVYVPGTCNNFYCIPRAIRKLVFFSSEFAQTPRGSVSAKASRVTYSRTFAK